MHKFSIRKIINGANKSNIQYRGIYQHPGDFIRRRIVCLQCSNAFK